MAIISIFYENVMYLKSIKKRNPQIQKKKIK